MSRILQHTKKDKQKCVFLYCPTGVLNIQNSVWFLVKEEDLIISVLRTENREQMSMFATSY